MMETFRSGLFVTLLSITLIACGSYPIFKARNESKQYAESNVQHVNEESVTEAENTAVDCSQLQTEARQYIIKADQNQATGSKVKVGATGYGAPPKNYYPEGQRRLMTMRASKVDAYRALAEIVGGLHVWGGSAIGDMVLEQDRYRSFIDTYVRGVRVISVSSMEDGTYKTVVEADVDPAFLSHVMTFVDPLKNRHCFNASEGRVYTYFGLNNVTPSFYYSE